MAKTPIEIMEEATSEVAQNLFRMKYPDVNMAEATKLLDDCVNETVFVINNFMRISSEIAERESKDA